MTSSRRLRPGIVLVACAFALGACGRKVTVPPHGLTVETLQARPEGDPVPTGGDVRAGRWRVEVVKTWIQTTKTNEIRGRAVLDLHVETEERDGGWVMSTEVSVREADGLASNFVRGFDGLRVRVALDGAGRPDPKTLRFEERAPADARSFLRGLWAAGLAGGTPWFPPGPLRVGDTWTREGMGGVDEAAALMDAEDAELRLEGGGRLEEVKEVGGETHLVVRLETLLTAEGTRTGGMVAQAFRLGTRDRGRGTFRARDGLPLAWTLEEDLVLHQATGEQTTTDLITLRVEGRTVTVSSD